MIEGSRSIERSILSLTRKRDRSIINTLFTVPKRDRDSDIYIYIYTYTHTLIVSTHRSARTRRSISLVGRSRARARARLSAISSTPPSFGNRFFFSHTFLFAIFFTSPFVEAAYSSFQLLLSLLYTRLSYPLFVLVILLFLPVVALVYTADAHASPHRVVVAVARDLSPVRSLDKLLLGIARGTATWTLVHGRKNVEGEWATRGGPLEIINRTGKRAARGEHRREERMNERGGGARIKWGESETASNTTAPSRYIRSIKDERIHGARGWWFVDRVGARSHFAARVYQVYDFLPGDR